MGPRGPPGVPGASVSTSLHPSLTQNVSKLFLWAEDRAASAHVLHDYINIKSLPSQQCAIEMKTICKSADENHKVRLLDMNRHKGEKNST